MMTDKMVLAIPHAQYLHRVLALLSALTYILCYVRQASPNANTDGDHCDSWYDTKEETPCCKQVNLLLASHYYSSWNKAQSRLDPSDQVCFFVVGFFFGPPHSISLASFPRQWSVQMDIIP